MANAKPLRGENALQLQLEKGLRNEVTLRQRFAPGGERLHTIGLMGFYAAGRKGVLLVKRAVRALDDDLAGRVLAGHCASGFNGVLFGVEAMHRALNAFPENQPVTHVAGQDKETRYR